MNLSRSRENPLKSILTIAAFIVFSIFLYFYFVKFQGNIYGFFRIGSVLPFSPYLDRDRAFIFNGQLGFDGQMFLSVAFDPLLDNPDTILTLDSPRLRYRRIFYPLLGHLLGFGNPHLIPYALVAINLASILGLVWIFIQYFKEKKWQSLLVLCVPGVWIVLSLSTADLLNSFLTVLAVYCYQYRRIAPSAIAIGLACLTKEIAVMMAFALILHNVWQRNWKNIPYFCAALIPTFAWNLYVLLKLKSQGFLGISENFGTPFVGIIQKLLSIFTGGFSPKNLFEAYSFLLLLSIFIVNLALSRSARSENRALFFATLFYGVLFVSSHIVILTYFLNYPRQYIEFYFLLLLMHGDRVEGLKLSLMAAAGLSSAVFILGHS